MMVRTRCLCAIVEEGDEMKIVDDCGCDDGKKEFGFQVHC
jgi:hypothetical protein